MSRVTGVVRGARLAALLGAAGLLAGGCPGTGGALPGSDVIAELAVTGAVAGGTGVLRITLLDPAGSAAAVALTSSDAAIAAVPATARIVAGSDTAEAAFTAGNAGCATVTARLGDSAQNAVVTVVPSIQLLHIEMPDSALQVGASAPGVVALNVAAPVDSTVALTSGAPGVVSVPAAVVVRAFDSEGFFPVTAAAVGSTTITAELDGTTRSSAVTVVALPMLSGLYADASRLPIGAVAWLGVGVSALPADDMTVALSTSDPTVMAVPAGITVPGGTWGAEGTLTAVAAGTTTITAEAGGVTQIANVAVTDAPTLEYVDVRSPLQTGARSSLAIYMDVDVLADTTVTLASSAPAVLAVPATATVPAGRSWITVPVTAGNSGVAVVTAQLGSSTAATAVIVVAVPRLEVGASSSALQVGAAGMLHVAMSADVAADAAVTLTNSNPAVLSIATSGVIPAGSSSETFLVRALSVGSANITVAALGQTRTVTFTTVTTPSVTGVWCGMVHVGTAVQLQVQLDATTAASTVITLTSGDPTKLAVPTGIMIQAGDSLGSASVVGLAAGPSLVTATLGASSASATVNVIP